MKIFPVIAVLLLFSCDEPESGIPLISPQKILQNVEA